MEADCKADKPASFLDLLVGELNELNVGIAGVGDINRNTLERFKGSDGKDGPSEKQPEPITMTDKVNAHLSDLRSNIQVLRAQANEFAKIS